MSLLLWPLRLAIKVFLAVNIIIAGAYLFVWLFTAGLQASQGWEHVTNPLTFKDTPKNEITLWEAYELFYTVGWAAAKDQKVKHCGNTPLYTCIKRSL